MNPVDWLKTAQDSLLRHEKSSGFRPFLVLLIIICVFSYFLIKLFPQDKFVTHFALLFVGIAMVAFIVLFTIKSFQNPDFCRSEKHIETMKKIELESFGTESKQIDAKVFQNEALKGSVKDEKLLPEDKKDTSEQE